MSSEVNCVFCNEKDFDLIGLKNHLNSHCDGYDFTPGIYDEILHGNVYQKTSDQWFWLKDGHWKEMTVEEQINWSR